jgi:hypothetical protein
VVPGWNMPGRFFGKDMNRNQTDRVRSHVVELRNRLQDVNSLLHMLASTGEPGSGFRDQLGLAIDTIQQVSEELAVLCDDPLGDPAERSFLATRESEAKSEVDSGEFDMHG